MQWSTFIVLVQIVLAAAVADGETTDDGTSDTAAVLTTSGGALVEISETDTLNTDPFESQFFIDSITHLVRERIPERSVHGKGTGAFGYFEVTNDISSICKAKLFSEVGKITPIALRFSLAFGDKGASDLTRDSRGFAVKFYTEDGNWDIVGFNTPMVPVKDPAMFSSVVHAGRAHPASNVINTTMVWDFLTARPEALFNFLFVLGDHGIPDGYRHMPGWGIHTYQLANAEGESNFARFQFMPCAGVKNLRTEEAAAITDTNYATRDLYESIENGDFPCWTMKAQILSLEDVQNASIDVFDVTNKLPEDTYPFTEVGRLVLNRNPANWFADMEQSGFNVGNLVPGVVGAPDKIFHARRVVYRDAQNYRIGANFYNIEVNSPLNKPNFYTRDGVAPVKYNGANASNYYPNSFNGPVPYVDEKKVELLRIVHDDSNNLEHMSAYYTNELDEGEKSRLVQNAATSINTTETFIKERAVELLKSVSADLGSRVAQALGLE